MKFIIFYCNLAFNSKNSLQIAYTEKIKLFRNIKYVRILKSSDIHPKKAVFLVVSKFQASTKIQILSIPKLF